jgi:two-component system nitrate/nitrite response regulator NarL
MSSVQVSIVDAHQLSREGVRLLLAGETYDVIGATSSLGAALADIEAGGRPDLLVVVLHDSGETFQSAPLQTIRTIVPECKVVLIASTITSSLPARVSGWGVNALLRSDMSRDVLTHSLRLVMQGQAIFPASSSMQPNDPDEITREAAEIAVSRFVSRSSDHEVRVLRHLVSGHSNKTIARDLALSDAAVKMHMKALLRKLNVHNRTQVAIWAIANGFSEKKSRASLSTVHSQGDTAEAAGVELVA